MTPYSCVCHLGKPLNALVLDTFRLKNFGVATGEACTTRLSSVIVSDGEVTKHPAALYADIRNNTLWLTTTDETSPPYFVQLPDQRLMHILEWVARNAAEDTQIVVYTLPSQPAPEDLATESTASDAP